MGRIFTGGVPERLPSFKGRMYTRRWKGKLIVCAWPDRSKTRISPRQKAAMQKFREASDNIKFADPKQVQTAMKYSAGTQALWRDLFFMAQYGRFPLIFVVDGKRIRPLAARNDVSELLNALGDGPGSFLFKDDDYWSVLPPGAPNQVLVMDPQTGKPAWSSVPTGATAPATLLHMTSDGPANTTWPKNAAFDAALYDDLGIWNPAQPTRLYVPPGATRVRLSYGVHLTLNVGARSWGTRLINDAGTFAFPGTAYQNYRGYTAGFSNNALVGATAWLPAAASEYYELQANVNPTFSGGFIELTWAMVEAQ